MLDDVSPLCVNQIITVKFPESFLSIFLKFENIPDFLNVVKLSWLSFTREVLSGDFSVVVSEGGKFPHSILLNGNKTCCHFLQHCRLKKSP